MRREASRAEAVSFRGIFDGLSVSQRTMGVLQPALLIAVAPLLLAPEVLPAGGQALVVATALIVSALAVAWLSPQRLLALPVAILALTGYLGWLQTSNPAETVSHFAGLSFGLFAMSVIASWCRNLNRLTIAVVVFLVGGTIALLAGLASAKLPTTKLLPTLWVTPLRLLPHTALDLPGLEGQVNANALGATALLIVPIAVLVASRLKFRGSVVERGWFSLAGAVGLRAFGATVAILSTIALVVSQSRTVWMAAVATLGAAVVSYVFRSGGGRWLVGVSLVAVTVSLSIVATRALQVGADTYRLELGVESRAALWGQGLSHLRKSPVMGIGLNEYRYVHRPPQPTIAHVHNVFLQTALDIGLVGFGAYIWLLFMLLARATRAAWDGVGVVSTAASGAALVLLGIHIFGITDAVSLGAKVGLFQWWAAGLALAAERLTAKTGSGPPRSLATARLADVR